MRAPFVNHRSNTEVDEGTGPARISGAWPVTPSFEHIQSPIGDTTTPVLEPGGEDWQALQAERAERHIILGRIRAHLEDQPSPRAIRASARRWSGFITVMGEAVAAEREAS